MLRLWLSILVHHVDHVWYLYCVDSGVFTTGTLTTNELLSKKAPKDTVLKPSNKRRIPTCETENETVDISCQTEGSGQV